jgi:ATP/maltotriose-dependent transcriptional regulator MalT
MPAPILATKLYIPPPRPEAVRRPRLIGKLNEGLHGKLTIVTAPAGFGKTTLVSEWVSGRERSTAWLSLDEGDSDPTRFLTYLIAALQTIAPDIGAGVSNALQSPQPPPTESVLAALLNDITAVPEDLCLVLDDYHMIDAKPVHAALTFLLDHMPRNMHVLLATREDPPLPLARYRAQGQLTEVRAGDLRFNSSEAAEFLNRAMGLNLSPQDIAALESRTEGWIVGLQLAALSMQGLQNVAGFVHSFTGSHRFVLDYLLEEVLHKQPASVQSFLLRTSILDRLCAPLCDELLQDPSTPAQEILEYLERANLFILPLDNERHWYRYHQLFAELLRHRLVRVMAPQLPELHRRASDWHARNDFPSEGIAHALAAEDWDRAADIIERYSDQLPMRSEINTRLRWFRSFPAQMLLERPRLGLTYAWTLLMGNQFDLAEQQLNQLRPFVQATPRLHGELLVIRVMLAARRFDMAALVEFAQQALALVPPEEAVPRSRMLLSLGVAYDEKGADVAATKSVFREAYELGMAEPFGSAVGNAPLALTALAYLSEFEWLQGNLREAYRMYEQALQLSGQWHAGSSLALCFVQQGRAGLLYEWNNLDGATQALQDCLRLGELWKSPRLFVPAYGLWAMIMQARAQPAEALAMIRRAEQTTRDAYPTPLDLGRLALYQLTLWVAQGDFQAIDQWEGDHDADWRAQSGRPRESFPILLAHGRIARYYLQGDKSALHQARALIEPALEQARAGGLMFNVTRLLMLHALVLYAQRETASALTTLKSALTLAEPETYVRSFLDLGKPMEELLRWSLAGGALSGTHLRAYAGRLLSEFGAAVAIQANRPSRDDLIEPLTERELEVLRLIAQGLSNREISERLFLALSTVKGHARVIFDKLQVQRRTEAVARARDLGLL